MKKFYKNHKTLSWLLIFSIAVVIAYLLTLDVPELFNHAGDYFTVLNTLALSCIASFIFYVVQVYVPEQRRMKRINAIVKSYINRIVGEIDGLIDSIAVTVDIRKAGENRKYTEEELQKLLILNSCAEIKVIKAQSYQIDKNGKQQYSHFILREWINVKTKEIDDIIDRVLKYYGSDLSPELVEKIEAVRKTSMMTYIKMVIAMNSPVGFNQRNDNFYYEFYMAGQELKKAADEELR